MTGVMQFFDDHGIIALYFANSYQKVSWIEKTFSSQPVRSADLA